MTDENERPTALIESTRALCAFLDGTVQPNMQLAMEEPGDERAATNAALTLDAFAGAIFWALKDEGHSSVSHIEDDDSYRNLLADEEWHFRVLRDLAASYKHGRLTKPRKKQPRLVTSPRDVGRVRNQCGLFQCGDRLGGSLLLVKVEGTYWPRASTLVGAAYRFLVPRAEELEARYLGPRERSRLDAGNPKA